MAGRKSKVRREKAIARAMGKYKSKDSAPVHPAKPQSKKRQSVYPGYGSIRDDEEFTITGIFHYSGKGFGFCEPAEEYAEKLAGDVFIPPRETMGAMTGDRVTVLVRASGSRADKDSRLEGEVVSVEYSCDSLIGTLHLGQGYAYVAPDEKRFGVIVYVPEKDADVCGASDGDKVEVIPSEEPHFTRTRSITVRGLRDMPYFDTVGRIAQVFGSSLSQEANYAAILYASGIRTEFSERVLHHANEVSAQEILPEGRADLRDRRILTIDGAGAKDLDDAISLERSGENWVLGVHIADVSHYVRQNTPTEEEARLRGTSVYFTDKVVPMLPESLSNGVCSLNAGTDKYALSAEITLAPEGKRLGTRIFKSLIRSKVRGVYTEVNDLFARGEDSEFCEKYREVLPMLLNMKTLYETLKAAAEERSVMELEDAEAEILLDETGRPVEVIRRERGDGEKLIEQFMLQANMGVAETLKALGLPCLYRIHEDPDKEKIKTFAVFAHNVGLDTRGIVTNDAVANLSSAELSGKLMAILSDANERGIGGIVSSVLLRSMMKAKYQSVCAPHFGLGAAVYCHFTSPIRRYPDLFVHTVITTVLEKTGLPELSAASTVDANAVTALTGIAAERGESSTECEIRAQNAEREIEDLYMALYMADRVGEEFRVTVCSVIRSGLFVQCDNLVEGFLPAAYFPGSRIDEERMTMFCGGTVYTLGTPMDVVLESADVGTGRITFAPVRGIDRFPPISV